MRSPLCHPPCVLDLSVPTTPAERRAARRTWAAYPYAVRREVLRAAKRGERRPDEGAARAGVTYAAAVLRPTGPRPWQSSRSARLAWPMVLAVAVVLAAEALYFLTAPGPATVLDWSLLALAVLVAAWALFVIDLRRECGRIVAAWTAAPAGH